MKEGRHNYSESFREYLQKKYAIMSAGVFLVVMMIAAPFLGSSGIASLIGQDMTTAPMTSETMPSADTTTMPSGSGEIEINLDGTSKGQGIEEWTIEDMHEAAPESGSDMGSESDVKDNVDNIQWDGSAEGEWDNMEGSDIQMKDTGDMNQPDMNMQQDEKPMEQDQICGQDGKTYASEDEATAAGTTMEHYGSCGKASAREIRDMERQIKGSNDFDLPRLAKDLKRSMKKIDQVIKGIQKYVAKAEKKGINEDFTTYASGKIAELTADKSDMATIVSDIEKYQGMAKTYLTELKNRLSAVKSGERSSQYFWNYSSRQDLFWLMKDAAERHVDKYRNEGYYDFLREFVKQRFEAAVQGVSDNVDWSVQDEIEIHFSDQRAEIDAIIEQMDAIEVEAESLLDDESLDREDFESARQDLRDERDSIMSDMEDIWEKDRDFWENEPWKNMDKIWKEIQWAQESSFALKDLEKMVAEINVARKVIPVGASIYEEAPAIKAWNELAKLIDEKVMPAAEKAKEKALELHNPEVIWHFFDKVMDPLTRFIEPKIGYLSDIFYSKYADTVNAEDYKLLDDFFKNAPRHDPKDMMVTEFDFEDEGMKANFMGKIDENLASQIVAKIIGNVSSDMLEKLNADDEKNGINLQSLLDTAAFSDGDAFKKLLEEKEKMSDQIIALQDQMKELRNENKELSNKLGDIAKYNFYGADKFQEKIAQIDVETMTDEKLAELEKEAEQAKGESREAKFQDKIIPFRDTDDDQWFTKFISQAKEEGIVSGKKDGSGNLTGNYDPTSNITNAEFAKMLIKASGENEASGEPSNEKARGHWAQGFFRQAENRGLDLAWLAPNESASRCTVAKSVVQIKGYELAEYNGEFSDVPVGDDCATYIATVKREGIMSGDSNGTTFRPYETLNRAEVAKVISKLLEKRDNQAVESFDIKDFMKDVEKMKAVETDVTMPENTKDNTKMEQSDEEFIDTAGDEVGFVERLKMVFASIGSLF